MKTHFNLTSEVSLPPTDPLEAVALGECFLYDGNVYLRTRLVRTTYSSYVQVSDASSPHQPGQDRGERRVMVIRLEDGHQDWLLDQEMVRPIELTTAEYIPPGSIPFDW